MKQGIDIGIVSTWSSGEYNKGGSTLFISKKIFSEIYIIIFLDTDGKYIKNYLHFRKGNKNEISNNIWIITCWQK